MSENLISSDLVVVEFMQIISHQNKGEEIEKEILYLL